MQKQTKKNQQTRIEYRNGPMYMETQYIIKVVYVLSGEKDIQHLARHLKMIKGPTSHRSLKFQMD